MAAATSTDFAATTAGNADTIAGSGAISAAMDVVTAEAIAIMLRRTPAAGPDCQARH